MHVSPPNHLYGDVARQPADRHGLDVLGVPVQAAAVLLDVLGQPGEVVERYKR